METTTQQTQLLSQVAQQQCEHTSLLTCQQKQDEENQKQEQEQEYDKRRERIVLTHTIITVLLFFFGVAVSTTVRPKLILDACNNNTSRAAVFNGIVLSLQSVLSAILSPVFGLISDSVGRKPVLLIAHIGEFVGLILIAMFPFSLVAIFIAYMLLASTMAYHPLINAIIADSSSHDEITMRKCKTTAANTSAKYAYVGSIFGICFLFGPALGGYLEKNLYHAASLHVGCIFIFLAFLYTAFILPETLPTSISTSSTITMIKTAIDTFKTTDLNPIPRARAILQHSPALKYLALTYAAEQLSLAALQSILFLYAVERVGLTVEQFGMILTAFGFIAFTSQLLLTRFMMEYLGEQYAIVLGLISLTISSFFYAFITETYHFFFILAFSAPGFVVDPIIKGILARQAPSCEQGGLQGSFSALGDIVKTFSPLLANSLLDLGLFINMSGLPMLFIASVKVVAVFGAWMAFRVPGFE